MGCVGVLAIPRLGCNSSRSRCKTPPDQSGWSQSSFERWSSPLMHLLTPPKWIPVLLWSGHPRIRLRDEDKLACKESCVRTLKPLPGPVNRARRRRGLENKRARCKALVGPFLQLSRPDWSTQRPWKPIFHHSGLWWQDFNRLPHVVQLLATPKPDHVLEVPNPHQAHILFQGKRKKFPADREQGPRAAVTVHWSQKTRANAVEGVGPDQGYKGSWNARRWNGDNKESQLWLYIGR